MRCWKCSETINDSFKTCPNCGIPLERTDPVTEEGMALRRIYDDFGAKEVLNSSDVLVSAIKDILPESESLCHVLQLSYYSGFGDLYFTQIKNNGRPTSDFYNRATNLLVNEVGLSEKKSQALISLFDEMIGWKMIVPLSKEIDKDSSDNSFSSNDNSKPEGYPQYDIQNNTPPVHKSVNYGLIGLILAIFFTGLSGLFVSIIGLMKARTDKNQNKSMSVTGIIVSIGKIILLLVLVLNVSSFVDRNKSSNGTEDRTIMSSSNMDTYESSITVVEPVSDPTGVIIDIPISYIIGPTYYNNLIGLGCTLDGWTYATENEIAVLNGITVDEIPSNLSELSQNAGDVFYDMYAVNEDGTCDIFVGFECLQSESVTEEYYIQCALELLEDTLLQAGASNIQIETVTESISDNDYQCIYMSYVVNGVNVYEREVLIKYRNYMTVVIVESIREDRTEELVSLFH